MKRVYPLVGDGPEGISIEWYPITCFDRPEGAILVMLDEEWPGAGVLVITKKDAVQ